MKKTHYNYSKSILIWNPGERKNLFNRPFLVVLQYLHTFDVSNQQVSWFPVLLPDYMDR